MTTPARVVLPILFVLLLIGAVTGDPMWSIAGIAFASGAAVVLLMLAWQVVNRREKR